MKNAPNLGAFFVLVVIVVVTVFTFSRQLFKILAFFHSFLL